MSRIDELATDFLAQKRIAVVGVSDRRETGCNLAYRKLKAAGHTVFPVNPRLPVFEGDRCFADLRAVPERPDGVFILANPAVTDEIVQQCVELGIPRVWMHCSMGTKPGLGVGTTSVSQEAVRTCRENGIAVIPGACPNHFLPSDFGHVLMRVAFRALGWFKVTENGQARRTPAGDRRAR